MNRVFISYRHVKPDEDLAHALTDGLERAGFDVFVDRHIKVGTDWVQEIEREIRAASAFVVLLSQGSILSDMVREEIRLAHELRAAGKLRILPIRIAFDSPLPYDLASYLNRIQYVTWAPPQSFGEIVDVIAASLSTGAPAPELSGAGPGAARAESRTSAFHWKGGAPMPDAESWAMAETGTIRLDSPFYIRRPTDDQAERAFAVKFVTCLVRGSRQSGKSSLLTRLRSSAERRGIKSAFVDFQDFDSSHMESLDSLMRALAYRIGSELENPQDPDSVWDPLAGPKTSIQVYLEKFVLTPRNGPVMLGFDEVDRVFDRPYRNDFFSGLRVWHNNRAQEPDPWQHLNLVLAHSNEPSLWIDDINQSPFNVGERVNLADFTYAEVAELNARYGHPLKSEGEIEGLVGLVGGQPYLVRQALYSMTATPMTLRELDERAVNERGPFGDHLRRQLWVLHKHEGLKAALASIIADGQCISEPHFQRLRAGGLVVGERRDQARLRCDLYRRYFAEHL